MWHNCINGVTNLYLPPLKWHITAAFSHSAPLVTTDETLHLGSANVCKEQLRFTSGLQVVTVMHIGAILWQVFQINYPAKRAEVDFYGCIIGLAFAAFPAKYETECSSIFSETLHPFTACQHKVQSWTNKTWRTNRKVVSKRTIGRVCVLPSSTNISATKTGTRMEKTDYSTDSQIDFISKRGRINNTWKS